MKPETCLLRGFLISTFVVALPASAQSETLLEAVRVHRLGVAADARAEYERCLEEKCPNRARLALLTGVLELSDGDAEQAAKRLGSEKAPKGLEAVHGWYFGEALSYAGQRAQALKTLLKAKKGAPGWLSTRIDRRLAELHLELGEHPKARALLDADTDLPRSPELLYTRALAREAGKLTALAQADWKTLAVKFPAHPHGLVARERLGAAWKPTFEEQLTRSRALLDAGDAAACLAELEPLKPSPADAPRLALLKGQALLTRGKERDAEGQAQLALAAKGPQPIAAQALMTSAKRLMRLTDNTAARAAFKKVDELYTTDPSADEAGYLAAWLAMNAGQLETAVADFAAYEERHPGSKKRDEARWFRGFSLVRAKKYAEAREVLLSLPVDFPKSSLTPQALYWAARSAQLAGPVKDGGPSIDVALEYRAVLNGFAGTFYALLASERLRELSAEAPVLFQVPPKALSVKRPPGLELAAQLSQTGLFHDAQQEVSRALSTVSAADALAWGHALQSLGDFNAAHTLAARYLWGAVYSQRTPEALALMYPRAFQGSVESWSKQHGLEPALAWAIMRRESAFAPEVTSIADARGLLQLIPPTARGVTDALKLPPVDPAQLYSPDWNIRLGTWYLKALIDRLQHPTLVAAAYNGGPDAVAKWAKERPEEPLDLWVEQIPYKETRGYVKQVTADLHIYRQLYGYEQKPLSLEIPKPGSGVTF